MMMTCIVSDKEDNEDCDASDGDSDGEGEENTGE